MRTRARACVSIFFCLAGLARSFLQRPHLSTPFDGSSAVLYDSVQEMIHRIDSSQGLTGSRAIVIHADNVAIGAPIPSGRVRNLRVSDKASNTQSQPGFPPAYHGWLSCRPQALKQWFLTKVALARTGVSP